MKGNRYNISPLILHNLQNFCCTRQNKDKLVTKTDKMYVCGPAKCHLFMCLDDYSCENTKHIIMMIVIAPIYLKCVYGPFVNNGH